MPPSKQLAMQRRTASKKSRKAKAQKMLEARLRKGLLNSDLPMPPTSSSLTPRPSTPSSLTPRPSTSSSLTPRPSTSSSLTPRPSTSSSPIPRPSTSSFEPQRQSSASKRKLELFSTTLEQPEPSTTGVALPTTFVDLQKLTALLSGQLCGVCCNDQLSLKGDPAKDQGLAIYMSVTCNACDSVISETFTSDKSSRMFDINRRVVAASLATGVGYSGLSKFTEYMNMPAISQRAHHGHMSHIEDVMTEEVVNVLKESAAHVKAANDTMDITVSFDGSWPKRGHTSRLGIGVVIEVKTGLVLDFHVMSTYCKSCSSDGQRVKSKNPEQFEDWAAKHKPSCTQNFTGSAGAMEVEAAKVMWSRSEALHGLRYTRLLSDGDTKTFSALKELSPYQDQDITKEECINHVAKRLNTALRNLVSGENKRGVRLGGSVKGSLTQTKMGLLQSYYTKAVRTHNSSVDEMSKAIWGGFYHSISTDDSPQHDLCSEDWCFYKKAVVKGNPPPPHSEKVSKTFLNERVASYVKPVYARLTDPVLLERCLLGKTQNANESLHSTIWSRCPKHLFGGLTRVRIAVALGVAEFNGGSTATQSLMAAAGCPLSVGSIERGKGRDRVRIKKAEDAKDEVAKSHRQKRLAAQQKDLEAVVRQEGGPAYVPGGFL